MLTLSYESEALDSLEGSAGYSGSSITLASTSEEDSLESSRY